MSPTFADKKGKVIYFATSRDESFGTSRDLVIGHKYMDIFMATYDEKGNPSDVRSIDTKGIVNTSQSEGSVCFDSKKKIMYFYNAEKKLDYQNNLFVYLPKLKTIYLVILQSN